MGCKIILDTDFQQAPVCFTNCRNTNNISRQNSNTVPVIRVQFSVQKLETVPSIPTKLVNVLHYIFYGLTQRLTQGMYHSDKDRVYGLKKWRNYFSTDMKYSCHLTEIINNFL